MEERKEGRKGGRAGLREEDRKEGRNTPFSCSTVVEGPTGMRKVVHACRLDSCFNSSFLSIIISKAFLYKVKVPENIVQHTVFSPKLM